MLVALTPYTWPYILLNVLEMSCGRGTVESSTLTFRRFSSTRSSRNKAYSKLSQQSKQMVASLGEYVPALAAGALRKNSETTQDHVGKANIMFKQSKADWTVILGHRCATLLQFLSIRQMLDHAAASALISTIADHFTRDSTRADFMQRTTICCWLHSSFGAAYHKQAEPPHAYCLAVWSRRYVLIYI